MKIDVTEAKAFDTAIYHALCEDLCPDFSGCFKGIGRKKQVHLEDVTTEAIFSGEMGRAIVFAKSKGILSGSAPFRRVFEMIDPEIKVEFFIDDSQPYSFGDVVAIVEGKLNSILMGERTALNFLGHLSGIATATNNFVKVAGKGRLKILDTRKTIPCLRILEKMAVKHGGGENHRMGLYDMVLIKDNHIDAAGSILEAVNRVWARWGNRYKIEVETRNLEEVKEALELKIDRIMLDNMSRRMVRKAVKLIGGRVEVEVSGNMTVKRVKRMRKLAINYISAGSITNAAGHADFSLEIER
ncbi:MAG: carboxylating nicotinate-nucleotide diphosphorylase, partial [Spirochaetota bacterium]